MSILSEDPNQKPKKVSLTPCDLIIAIESIKVEFPNAKLDYFLANFGDLAALKKLADDIAAKVKKLDIFL